MKVTPQDINNQEFKRSLRGYDMDEVDAFLTQVADELEARIEENQHLKDRVKSLEEQINDYRKNEEALKKLLFTAQQLSEQMKDTSRRESEAAAAQAKAEAQRIVAEAHRQLVRIQSQIDDLRRARDAFLIQYRAFLEQQMHLLHDFARSGALASNNPPAAVPAPKAGGAGPEAGGRPTPSSAPKPKTAVPDEARPPAAGPPKTPPSPPPPPNAPSLAATDAIELEIPADADAEEPIG